MNAVVFVAFAGVAPIENENAAVRAVTDFHAAEPRIGRREEIRSMFADIAAPAAFENFFVAAAAMLDIEHCSL